MNIVLVLLSFILVSFGQPSLVPWLGVLSSAFGYGLFWKACREISLLKRRIILAILWYASVQAVQLSWMTSTEYQGMFILLVYVLLIFILGCQFGLVTFFIPSRNLKWFDILGVASLWVLLEWCRLLFLCGLSFNFSGMSLTSFFIPMQMASIFGILGLSFYVIATNLLFLCFLERKFEVRRFAVWGIVAIFPYVFGLAYIKLMPQIEKEGSKELSIALVQTNLSPKEKNYRDDSPADWVFPLDQWQGIFNSLKQTGLKKMDLIVMPEGTVPNGYDRPVYDLQLAIETLTEVFGPGIKEYFPQLQWPSAKLRKTESGTHMFVSNAFFASTLSNYFDSELIIGLDHEQREEKKSFNSAFHFIPRTNFQKRYDKQILVPIGEYLPFSWVRKIAKKFGIEDFFSHGKENVIFQGKIPMGISICYEETFPKIMRNFSKKGAHLFVNLTNDAWYPKTNLFKQHLYHARVRAVENGIPHVRACNGGVSAYIDQHGKILLKLEKGEKTLFYSLPIKTHSTLYQIWGDYLILGICGVFFFFLLDQLF